MPRTTPAADRARRLLALLGRLHNGARIPVGTLASELGTTERELAGDLESLSMCGIAPYDPWALVPIVVEDGYVEVFGDLPAVRGAVRLSPAEASALAAALQTAGFSADDPLTDRLLAASAADFDAAALEQMVRTGMGAHDREVYETLAASARDRAVTEIEHAGTGSDHAECREVEPVKLFAERGAWYLSAWCRRAGGWRTFRLDRVRSARPTGERFTPRTGAPDSATALDLTDLPVATLRFATGEPFVEREWPGGRIVAAADDGSLTVEVPYAGTAWVARHVVARLGAVEALGPAEIRDAVRELAGA